MCSKRRQGQSCTHLSFHAIPSNEYTQQFTQHTPYTPQDSHLRIQPQGSLPRAHTCSPPHQQARAHPPTHIVALHSCTAAPPDSARPLLLTSWHRQCLPQVQVFHREGHQGGVLLNEEVILGEPLELQCQVVRQARHPEPPPPLPDVVVDGVAVKLRQQCKNGHLQGHRTARTPQASNSTHLVSTVNPLEPSTNRCHPTCKRVLMLVAQCTICGARRANDSSTAAVDPVRIWRHHTTATLALLRLLLLPVKRCPPVV